VKDSENVLDEVAHRIKELMVQNTNDVKAQQILGGSNNGKSTDWRMGYGSAIRDVLQILSETETP
jgi:hypothetical protein